MSYLETLTLKDGGKEWNAVLVWMHYQRHFYGADPLDRLFVYKNAFRTKKLLRKYFLFMFVKDFCDYYDT